MAKLGLFAALTAVLAGLGLATLSSGSADAADACIRKDFKTEMVRDACTKGGQAEAKKQMQAFNKDKKIKSCNQCHTKLAPNYELKPDGVDQYVKLGGKLVDGKAAAPDKPAGGM